MAKAVPDQENSEPQDQPTAPTSIPVLIEDLLNRFAKAPFRIWGPIAALLVLAVGAAVSSIWGHDVGFPAQWGRTIGREVDEWIGVLTTNLDWLFDGIKKVVLKVMVELEDGLLWVPWPAILVAVGLLAWRVSGLSLAFFASAALLLIGLMGRLPDNPESLWASAMETIALILVSVVICLMIGIPLGILGARSRWVDNIMRPILDGAQTMPSFVYLVPAVLLFGLGTMPGVMATVIYAMPPVIRLTNLGIRQVAPQTVEAARSFGTTPTQLLVKVQIPMALPTIMAGVNQTTMLALSMVVVASLVAAGGLGEVVLRALGRREAGNALIGGLAIVFIAVVIDRITQAMAKSREQALSGGH